MPVRTAGTRGGFRMVDVRLVAIHDAPGHVSAPGSTYDGRAHHPPSRRSSFTLDSWDQHDVDVRDGLTIAAAHVTKTFSGDLVGVSTADLLLAAADAGSRAYCGFERVTGTVARTHRVDAPAPRSRRRFSRRLDDLANRSGFGLRGPERRHRRRPDRQGRRRPPHLPARSELRLTAASATGGPTGRRCYRSPRPRPARRAPRAPAAAAAAAR